MKDANMAMQIFTAMLAAETATVVDYVLMYKAVMMGVIGLHNSFTTTMPHGITQSQRNSLLFMKHFVTNLLRKKR
jgi:hypothetical protein